MSLYGKYYLQHHGVKGMKWGVRKDRKRPGLGIPTRHGTVVEDDEGIGGKMKKTPAWGHDRVNNRDTIRDAGKIRIDEKRKDTPAWGHDRRNDRSTVPSADKIGVSGSLSSLVVSAIKDRAQTKRGKRIVDNILNR